MTITGTRFAAQATPLRGGRQASKRATEPALFADLEPAPTSRAPIVDDGEFWRRGIREALVQRSPRSLVNAEQSLRICPLDPELLLLGALTAIASGRPERGLALLKRYAKRYVPNKQSALLSALALGAQDQYAVALAVLRAEGLESDRAALRHFVGDEVMGEWLRARLAAIRLMGNAALRQPRAKIAPKPVAQNPAAKSRPARPAPSLPALPVTADLPKLEARFDIAFEIANPAAIAIAIATSAAEPGAAAFRLRGELVRLSLFEGFDELLCLPALQGVEAHWYQVETVRKVLKQYRGRVLLADEVGLGKTVEAGMVLREYILRGMAERILILTPASLVGQWRDEMAAKFGIACATSHDPLLRTEPAAFWAQPLVIASIASVRRKEHAEVLARLDYDVVVVDEAHHLRDQSSASYQLVNRLQKRFLLLLSATPVQNSLLELYNLLTLLQPGIFKTQKEFRSVYMVPGKPREPANRERLRDLMRGVMVRNT